MGRLVEVSKAKKRTTRQDVSQGAAAAAGGFAAASPRHYQSLDDTARAMGYRGVTPGVKAGFTAMRGVKGAAVGAVGGLGVNALRREQKETASKAATPVGASRLAALALKAKNPQVQTRAFSALERNLAGQSKARVTKSHGVGRNMNRAKGQTTNVTRVTARTPQGKFVSHENDLAVFHTTPTSWASKPGLGHGRKNLSLLSKADDKRQSHGGQIPQANRVGRRISDETLTERSKGRGRGMKKTIAHRLVNSSSRL